MENSLVNPSANGWENEDRPREKLMRLGPEALSDAELLAVLIGSGTAGQSAMRLGEMLLEEAEGSLTKLGKIHPVRMQTLHGMGLARSVSIAAALELGRRRNSEDRPSVDYIHGSADIGALFQPLLADLPHEEVWVLLLTRSKKIIERFRVSQGGVEASVIDPRIVLRRALDRNASALVLVHNHPSGNLTPSDADVMNTNKVKMAAAYFDMRLLDHVIVADTGTYSFAEHGLL